MRALRLAKVAAQAEVLRLREMSQRQARRAVIAAVGGFFLVAFLVAGHIAIGMALVPTVTPVQAVLIVGGGDLLLAIVLTLVAVYSPPGKIEREAAELGRKMREEIHASLTVPALIGGATRAVGMENAVRLVWSIVSGHLFRRRRA